MRIKAHKRGFTLIELLVVSTIIIILMGIGIISYRGAQRKARDSKRKSDLEQVRSALEMYRSDAADGYYPATGWSAMVAALALGDYLGSPPVDPKGYSYTYQLGIGGYTYNLCAYLEGENPGTCSGATGCGTGIVCNYGVSNP